MSARKFCRIITDIFVVSAQLIFYFLFKLSPHNESAYQRMVRLFCNTNGLSNDFFGKVIATCRGKYPICVSKGSIVCNEVFDKKNEIISKLKSEGFYIFSTRLPDEMCDEIKKYALVTPGLMSNQCHENEKRSIFKPEKPMALRYDIETSELIQNHWAQKLMCDEGFLKIAEDYLGCKPILDIATLWWNAHLKSSKSEEVNKAAMKYHFDMDRIKWLKIFIYITDVTKDSGPHTFVIGSHRRGGIPTNFLDRGYARLSDAEIIDHYGSANIKELVAPRGTIIVEDTRGLHKGKMPKVGARLIFQLEFCSSLFGAAVEKADIRPPLSHAYANAINKYPETFQLYNSMT